jgi:Zn-dependent protease/CBS domain-containing protein
MSQPHGGAGQGQGQGQQQDREQDPFRAGLPLGTVGGIKIRMNWSVAIIFVLIALGLAVWQFPAVNPHQSPLTYVLAGILTTVAFFASLLAHELAHSLVARKYGLTVKSITLWLFGGVSDLRGDVPSPAAEAWIAGVGPLTSLLLGGIFIGLAELVGASHPARASIAGVVYFALAYLGIINVTLAVFNVLPAAPLDGGRVLRAVIWWRTGDRVKATVWADRAGQVLGSVLIVGGLYAFFLTGDWSWVWTSLIGWFLTGAATSEAQQAVLTGRLRGVRASQVMTPHPVTVPGSMTVSQFLDDDLFRARFDSFPVTADGGNTVDGLVTLSRIRRVPADQRDRTTLAQIACPLSDVATARPDEPVSDILPHLTECADERALVFSNGHLDGIITPSDITRMLDRLGRLGRV